MKRNFGNPFARTQVRLAPTTAALSLLISCLPLCAAPLYWDGTDTTADADGGSGAWDLATPNWDSAATGGGANTWTGVADQANFGGAAGTVTTDTDLGAQGLVFTTPGYVLEGSGLLTLAGGGVNTTALAGGSTTIATPLIASANQTWNLGAGTALQLESSITGGKEMIFNGGVVHYSGDVLSTGKFIMRAGAVFNTTGTGNVPTGSYFGVGDGSDGSYNQTDGMFSTANTVFIGNNANAPLSTGTMTITGGTFAITSTGTPLLHIGNGYNGTGSGIGVLTIGGSGTLDTGAAAGGVRIGNDTFGSGTLNLNAGGTFATNYAISRGFGAGTAGAKSTTLNFNGGTLKANGANLAITSTVATINVRDGGAVVDSNGFDIAIDGNLAHSAIPGDAATDGGLTKNGAGQLVLGGVNTYTGPTHFNGGGLFLAKPGSLPGWNVPGALTVGAGMSLGGRVGGDGFSTADFASLLGAADFSAGSSIIISTQNGAYVQTADLGAATSAGPAVGLIKQGANSLTIDLSAQTFTGNIKSTTGMLILNESADSTYAGSITGGGDLTKSGAGMLSLTGGPSSVSQFFADGGVTNIPGTFKTTAKFTVRMGATVNASGTLTNTGSYTGFGDATDGTMNLTGGSFLSSPSLGTFIGNNSVGRLNISGGSFTIGTNSNFSIGNGYNNNGGGNGTLAISGSGSFSTGVTTGNFLLGASGAGAGTGTIDLNGGTFATSRVITKGGGGGAAANVNFNGGVLRAEGTTAGIASNVTANVRNGGAVLDTNGFDVTLDANLAHSGLGGDAATDGGLRKRGAGNLILNGPLNSYNGKTAVEGGALTIYDPFLADSSDVVIAGGAVLNLDGLYNGAFTDTVGTLVIGGVPAAVGTWGAVGNASADFTSASITGAGMLRVTALGTAGSAFDSWISTNYPALTGASALAGGDPDRDGASNLLEFALNGDPTSGANQGLEKVVIQDASAPAGKELTLVAAVRRGAAFASGAGGSQTATQDGVVYRIQGSLDLDNFASAVSHVATSDTAAGLPDLTGQAWEYHTFKLDASEGLGGKGFLRIRIEGAP